MAYAKIDVGFIRDHFSEIPDKTRPAAIALYLELVLASAEMLLDGRLPRGVVEVGAHRSGVLRGRYARREIASVASSLADSALVEIATDGMWTILHWNEHHSSRAEVEEARSKAAKRKHRQRHGVTDDALGDTDQGMSRRDFGRDTAVTSRARGTAANTKKDLPLHEPELDHPAAGEPDEEPDLETPGDPAAAAESPTESDIRAACTRFDADLNIVEPYARQLPSAVFAAVVTKHAAKVRRGSADDVPALFVDLLKRELKAQTKAIATTRRVMPPTRLPEAERPTKVEGDDWIRHIVPTLTAHPFERVEKFVTDRATAEGWTDDDLARRLELARTLHAQAEPDLEPAAA